MDIDNYKKDAESFLGLLEKEYYLHFAGLKPRLELEAIYDKYQDLFSKDKIDLLTSASKKAKSGDGKKKFAYLVSFCTGGLIDKKVKRHQEEIADTESNLKVDIGSKEVPFRFSEVILANEKDKNKRDNIETSRNEKTEKVLNPKLEAYWQDLHKIALELGYKSYKDLYSELKKLDIDGLGKDMDRLLEETEEVFMSNFPGLFKSELGLELEDSKRSDFAYFKRATKYDVFFKKENIVEIFKDTLLNMGIDINRQRNIIFDIAERENKSPRAFCSTVSVPDEIYLVIMPTGGQDDYEALLHEGGHAEHFANARKSLEFEYKYLGDNSVTEGYAFVFENLMHNSGWLKKYFNMSQEAISDFMYFSNMIKLWFLRRYAAKLRYEISLHDGSSLKGKERLYSELLSSAIKSEFPASSYLKDVDEGFYCTNYIRAWIFEAQLKEHMKEEYGYNWFDSKKAGDFLKEIFSYGQRFTPEEVLDQLGFDGLDIGVLIESLKNNIKI